MNKVSERSAASCCNILTLLKKNNKDKKSNKKKGILFSSAKCPTVGAVGKEWASKKH